MGTCDLKRHMARPNGSKLTQTATKKDPIKPNKNHSKEQNQQKRCGSGAF